MELLTHLQSEQTSPGLQMALGTIREGLSCSILTRKEEKELAAFTNEKRRCEYISTRYLLRKLIGSAGLNPDRISTHKDELGKPYGLYEGEHMYMSIAHTDNKILCALSMQADIGVDIERADRKTGERLRARILQPEEEKQLGHVESIRLWTIKEAAVKLSGSGLRTNLNEVPVTPIGGDRFLAIFNDEKTARICSFKHKNYWIAVAYFD